MWHYIYIITNNDMILYNKKIFSTKIIIITAANKETASKQMKTTKIKIIIIITD